MRLLLGMFLLLAVVSPAGWAGEGESAFPRFNEFNMQPEVWHFSGPLEGTVDSKGDLHLSIPILTVPGSNGLDFPVAFSYKAGVLYHQTASWIGLGWNFDPGSITRDVLGNMIIEGGNYGVDYEDMNTRRYLPDAYYATLPEKGTFTFARSTFQTFNQFGSSGYLHPRNGRENNTFYLETYRPYRIEALDISQPGEVWWAQYPDVQLKEGQQDIKSFVITSDDGTRYVFSLPSLALYRDYAAGAASAPAYIHAYPNVWRLTGIAGPDFAGDIRNLASYAGDNIDKAPPILESYKDWVYFEYDFDAHEGSFGGLLLANQIFQNTYVKRIVTPTHFAEFITAERRDIDLEKYALSSAAGVEYRNFSGLFRKLQAIVLYSKTAGAEPVEVRRAILTQDYQLGINSVTGRGKLTLKQVDFQAGGKLEPGYKLDYGDNPEWDFAVDVYSYDGWGYYNDQIDPALGGIDTHSDDAQAWSLAKITFPSGGSEEYQYDNDAIADIAPFSVYFYDQTENQIFWRSFSYGDQVHYPGISGRRQGGVRVTKIIQRDGLGNNLSIDLEYGPGHAPGLPFKLVPWIHQHNQYPQIRRNSYRVVNRGNRDVVYQWVRKKYPGGDSETTHYRTYGTGNGSFEYPVRRQNIWLVGHHAGQFWFYFADNQSFDWGTPFQTVVRRRDITETREYFYDTQIRIAAMMHPLDAGMPLKQYSPVIIEEKHTVKKSGDPPREVHIQRDFTPFTRQLSESITTAGGKAQREVVTYAHEIAAYGGGSWDPAALAGLRLQNRLTRRASEDRYYRAGSAAFGLQSALRTTFREVPPWPENPFRQNAAGSVWKIDRQYVLRSESGLSTPPNFAAWEGEDPADDRWQRQFRVRQYRYGEMVEVEDGRDNRLQIYYGDNSNNQNSGNDDNRFGRAYVTAIRAQNPSGSDLVREFDYDERFMQVATIKDENGQRQKFFFDEMGRLKKQVDAKGETVAEYAYQHSRSPAGDFNRSVPNFLRSTVHYHASQKTDSYQYFDGRGQLLQTVTRAEGEDRDYYVASERDGRGRLKKEHRPYRRNAAGSRPEFQQSPGSDGYTSYRYQDGLSEELQKITHPDDSEERREYGYFSAGEVVSGVNPPDGVWHRERRTDEAGHRVDAYTDEFGNEVFREQVEERLKTYFEYDGAGNILAVYPPNYFDPPGGSSAADWVTRYRYNTLNQLLEKQTPDTEGEFRYKYDPNGNVRFSQDPAQRSAGKVSFTKYDFLERPLVWGEVTRNFEDLDPRRQYAFEENENNWISVYAYDRLPDTGDFPWKHFDISTDGFQYLKGQLSASAHKSNDTWQVVLYGYDENGLPVRKDIYSGGIVPLKLGYQYNRQGQLMQTGVQLGSEQFYHFYEYDERGQLSEICTAETDSKPSAGEIVYSYHPAGTIKQIYYTIPDVALDFSYNRRDWLTDIGKIDDLSSPFAAQYQYAADGNIRTADFYKNDTPPPFNTEKRYRYIFSYDGAERLTEADYAAFVDGKNGSEFTNPNRFDVRNLRYDRNGNLLSLDRYSDDNTPIDELTYTYQRDNNQVTKLVDQVGSTAEPWDAEDGDYGYDENGNLISVSGIISSITYDRRNLPLKIEKADGATIEYRYNEAGQRIYKKVSGQPGEHYLLDNARVLGVFRENEGLQYWNIIGTGVLGRVERAGNFGDIRVSPTGYDFGAVTVGNTSAAALLEIYNEGTAELLLNRVALDGSDPSEFVIETGNLTPVSILPGESHAVRVVFQPQSRGSHSADLQIDSNDPDENSVTVSLMGEAVSESLPKIAVNPSSFDFGNVLVNSEAEHDFEIGNTGEADLTILKVDLVGLNAEEFGTYSGPSAPFILQPGESDLLTVRFQPVNPGPKTAQLRIESDDPEQNFIFAGLSGNGSEEDSGGNGELIALEDLRRGGATSTAIIQTLSPVLNVEGHLYLTAISSKPFRPVSSVSGMGLTWNLLRSQCAGRNQAGIEVWIARGSGGASGTVTAILGDTPNNAAILVARYSGVDQTNPLGNLVSGNTNGMIGSCSGGVDSDAYALPLSTSAENARIVGFASMRSKNHLPGNGFTEQDEFRQGDGGSAASIALQDRPTTGISGFNLNGSFSGTVDWAVLGLEIKPGEGDSGGGSDPVADITITPDSHDFGTVTVDGQAKKIFRIGNSGSGDLTIQTPILQGGDVMAFSISSGGSAVTVAPGDQHDIEVLFYPRSTGVFSATLVLQSNDPDEGSVSVPLSGSGVSTPQPDIAVTPDPYNFGNVAVNSWVLQTFEISNVGSGDLEITAMSLGGDYSADFRILAKNTSTVIPPGDSYSLDIQFVPGSTGSKIAELSIASNDPDEDPYRVILSGNGVDDGSGGGNATITFHETVTGGAGASGTVTTAGDVSGGSDQLYLAVISTKPYRPGSGVSGLGLTWTLVETQCSGRGQTGVEIWMAEGNSVAGAVTAALSSDRIDNAAIMVARYSGVGQADPLGNILSGNTNGSGGNCSGGTDSEAYSFTINSSARNAVLVSAVSMRSKNHRPGSGFVERDEFVQGSGGSATSIALQDKKLEAIGAAEVGGTLSGTVDWAVIVLELKPLESAAQ